MVTVLMAGPVGSSMAHEATATAAKHKRPTAIAVATRYVRDAIFEDPYLNAEENANVSTWKKYNFCHSEYEFRFGHPSLQNPADNNSIQTIIGGNWHISHARLKNGHLRTATIAYAITDFQSQDDNGDPGDPQPPSPGAYSLTAHGPRSATIDGSDYTRYGQDASCGVGGPGGF